MLMIPRLFWSCTFAVLGVLFTLLYVLDGARAWRFCYALALFSAFLYLWKFRRNFFSLVSIFVALSLVGITLPAVPYLFLGISHSEFFFDSIYINSVGLFFFLAVSFLKSPLKFPKAPTNQFLTSPAWRRFYRINAKICLISFPFVLLAITIAGAWNTFFNDLANSGYDRIASMKGMGPLMIFSVINMTAAFFWSLGDTVKDKKWKALATLVFFSFVNGFTYSRGHVIFVFFAACVFYMLVQGVNRKILIFSLLGGMLIVWLKLTRGWGVLDQSWELQFFLQFVGDFDSLNNCTALIEYTKQNGFFGLYHIWSNILMYVPRELYPSKPHDIGGLYLNTYLFPGVYLGAQGGTGLSLGFQGIWYAVAGLPSLIFGNLLLGWCLSICDRKFAKYVKIGEPTVFLIAYIMLIGQSIIIYRDGFYAFLNIAFYMTIYWLFVKFFLRGRREIFMPSRVVDQP